MKILAISNYSNQKKKKDSSVHLWRVKRPLQELQKHVDWQIDFRTAIITDFKGLENDPDEFIKQHGTEVARDLGQYDIVFASYFTSPHVYTLLWGANKAYGTKYVIDIDDDLYNVDPSNFAFWKSAGWQGHYFLKTIASVAPFITTTNKKLADKIKANSESDPKVFVLPNYMSEQYPDQTVDNGDKVVIGFFGGASHYNDVHQSGMLPALEKLMHENKNVYVKMCGQPADHYLPRGRTEQVDTAQGTDWPTKLLPSLSLDIACAPLLDTEFNQYKSDIKWQEATRVGSVFVGTDTGPYSDLTSDIARLVPNNVDAWYVTLKDLVEHPNKRKTLVKNAKKALGGRMLENHWQEYKKMFEDVQK